MHAYQHANTLAAPMNDFSLPTSSHSLSAGARLGDTILHERLATGGFGSVWRAMQVPSGRDVAVKILHAHLVSSEDVVRRFEREIEAVGRVKHPGIVELLGSGRLPDGRPYLVTELLTGETVASRIERTGAFSPELTLHILSKLGQALTAAHAEQIIHRDLKASNVMLCEDGGRERVVLVDFGLAKLCDKVGPGLTASTTLVGSLACIAPEQIRNQDIDERTDVYALGALAYHMLTGAPPFAGESPSEALNMHLRCHPSPPSIRGGIPAQLDEPIMKAMSKDPGNRYPSPKAFVEVLRRAVVTTLAPATRPRMRRVWATGIYVEAGAAEHDLADPDDALLDDLDAVAELARGRLTALGYRLACQRGDALLFVLPCVMESGLSSTTRREVLAAAKNLYQRLVEREPRDERTQVRVCAHSAEVYMQADTPSGGPLLELGAWVPERWEPGLFATSETLCDVPAFGDRASDAGLGLRRLLPASAEEPAPASEEAPTVPDDASSAAAHESSGCRVLPSQRDAVATVETTPVRRSRRDKRPRRALAHADTLRFRRCDVRASGDTRPGSQ